MSHFFVKAAVRTLFALTSRERAAAQCRDMLQKYSTLVEGVTDAEGRRPVRVPPMRGIDEDMRNWSLFMILEHNAIVNRSITATITQLARREPLRGEAMIHPKHDVMPSAAADPSQVSRFTDTIRDHLKTVADLPALRRTPTSIHPVFGPFDAHRWNCMFPFHLRLHLAQARFVIRRIRSSPKVV